MGKYLYGASIQGIQGFIFETNKLQEIVGASEIIKDIEDSFKEEIEKYKTKFIMSAAGNMKAVFYNKDELQEFLLYFKKETLNRAYGLTFSEAIVEIEDNEPNSNERTILEERLKIQRNRPSIPLDLSLNITKLASSTAKGAVLVDEEILDMASYQKREAYKKFLNNNPRNKEFKNISDFSNSKNKVAVIHIDGNGLGSLIKNLKGSISEFSKNLDNATKEAFKLSCDDSMDIREVILGGDDVTVICNANNALEFTYKFLKNFELKTKDKLGSKLTACAGIAICNEKFPFHYAVDLAEELCKEAKKDAKKINPNLAPSCLMFHNIQSSNFENWDLYIENELTIRNDKEEIRLDFGPYYLDEKEKPKIRDFIYLCEIYRFDDSPITRLRNWLSELDKNSYLAKALLKRINEVSSHDVLNSATKVLQRFDNNLSSENLIIKKDNHYKTPIYDVLQIISNTQRGVK